MRNLNYETVDVKISKDEITSFPIDTHKLINGKIIAIAFYVQGNVPDDIVNLTLKYNGGNKVFRGSTIKDWIPRTGAGYIEGMKPVNVDAGQQFTLEFSSKAILVSDLVGQVVFVIDQSNMC